LEKPNFSLQKNCYADLHIHSIYSDGSLTPFEIINICKQLELKVISITDHDTVSGLGEVFTLARGDVEIIPAVEMSSNIGYLDIHILGYYIDYKNGELLAYLEDFKKHRIERVKKIIKKLSDDGIQLEFEQIKAVAQNCSLGRPHIAEVLVENGYVRSINEAFSRYLGYGLPYYEPKKDVHPKEVINRIKRSHGIPVIAHPGTINDEQIIYSLIMHGAQGIEVWHPEHNQKWQQQLYEIALKNGLLMTGGSDCHGRRGGFQIGCIGCSEDDVLMMKRHHQEICKSG